MELIYHFMVINFSLVPKFILSIPHALISKPLNVFLKIIIKIYYIAVT